MARAVLKVRRKRSAEETPREFYIRDDDAYMFGWLNINKPPGLTSRDVVNAIQRRVAGIKIGHAGTLDPLATGVLVLGLGPATRLIRCVQQQPKRYWASFRFGYESPTDDIDGPVREIAGPLPEREQLERVCRTFVGSILQVPPQYSAVKVRGERAYRIARKGKSVVLDPRSVWIYSIDLLRYCPPDWEIRVECSSGTYIRALGRDIARALGTSSVLVNLRREAIGDFTLDRATRLDCLTDTKAIAQALIAPVEALHGMRRIRLDAQHLQALACGRWICLPEIEPATAAIAAMDADGRLVAVLEYTTSGAYRPVVSFAAGTHIS